MKQYTRVYVDPSTGEIRAVHTQDLPFAPGFEPVVRHDLAGNQKSVETHDLEVETESFVRAGVLRANLERASDGTIRFRTLPPRVIALSQKTDE